MKPANYDFSGWATRFDIRCSDGRTIQKDAFNECDGITVPLVWSHRHDSPEYVLGHALLECRPEGVYTYGVFNQNELSQNAKAQVSNGDITSLSIFANHLKQDDKMNVSHGSIKEVSLVLAGANPGAYIDYSVAHDDEGDLSGIIYNPIEQLDIVAHADTNTNNVEEDNNSMNDETLQHEEETEEDVDIQAVVDSMTEDQKTVMLGLIGQAIEDTKAAYENNSKGDDDMKHNAFQNETNEETLSHAEISAIFADAQKSSIGNLKDACLAHGITDTGKPTSQGGTDITNWLFPDFKKLDNEPPFITRETTWVGTLMNGVKHTPFSRIKSLFADLREEDARAKGYLTKGTQKVEEIIKLLKRTTEPTTVYKLQKFDRDDILDITDFDVVMWIKKEMRFMLDEEIARAILIGDGRSALAGDKIDETKIRPIWTDADLFTIKAQYVEEDTDTDTVKVKKFIHACVRARKDYKGSGNPVLFTTEDVLTDCLLMEDTNGRVIYETPEKLATALRVSKIVTVEVMENKTRVGAVGGSEAGYTFGLKGIIVNPTDYNVGADKGGAVAMFDDFNIDYNKQSYLIETRCSGALVKPYSAIAVETKYPTPEAVG